MDFILNNLRFEKLEKLENDLKKEQEINHTLQLQINDMNKTQSSSKEDIILLKNEIHSLKEEFSLIISQKRKTDEEIHLLKEISERLKEENELILIKNREYETYISYITQEFIQLKDLIENDDNKIKEVYEKQIFIDFFKGFASYTYEHFVNPFMKNDESKVLYYQENIDDVEKKYYSQVICSYIVTNNQLLIKYKFNYGPSQGDPGNIGIPPFINQIDISSNMLKIILQKTFIKMFNYILFRSIEFGYNGQAPYISHRSRNIQDEIQKTINAMKSILI